MEEVTLLDVVDTALNKGVVLQGSATISVADVDLVFLGLRLVLASVDTLQPGGRSSAAHVAAEGDGGDIAGSLDTEGAGCGSATERGTGPTAPSGPAEWETEGSLAEQCRSASGREQDVLSVLSEAKKVCADPDKMEQGLAKLVLTVVELLRQLLERQALRRMEHGSLTDEEIERMGLAFQRLEGKMAELRGVFGLDGEELNLNLGPLGNLI
jgi:hypothetical protein